MLDPGVLLLIMGFRLPGFLQLILPLGLFLGILLAYRRLYLESRNDRALGHGHESAPAGLQPGTGSLVAALVGWLSLGLAPQGIAEVDRILNQQDSLTEFDTLVPGRFQTLRGGSRVTYTRELSADRSELGGVFISETNVSRQTGKESGLSVLVAESGRQEIQPDGSRYLILENGYRYDGNPGRRITVRFSTTPTVCCCPSRK